MVNSPDNRLNRQREILIDSGYSRRGANILLLSALRYMRGRYSTMEEQEADIKHLIGLVKIGLVNPQKSTSK